MQFNKKYMVDEDCDQLVSLSLKPKVETPFDFEGKKYYVFVDLHPQRNFDNYREIGVVNNTDNIIADYYNSAYKIPGPDARQYFYADSAIKDEPDFYEQNILEPVKGTEHFNIRIVGAFIAEVLKHLSIKEIRENFLKLEHESILKEKAELANKQNALDERIKLITLKLNSL